MTDFSLHPSPYLLVLRLTSADWRWLKRRAARSPRLMHREAECLITEFRREDTRQRRRLNGGKGKA